MRELKFEYPSGSPTTTIELSYAVEQVAPTWSATSGSVIDEALDGTTYSYNKGTPQEIIPLTVDLITSEERDSLIDFINDVVEGSFKTFKFTNHDDEGFDVKFLDELFDFGDGTFPYSFTVSLLKV